MRVLALAVAGLLVAGSAASAAGRQVVFQATDGTPLSGTYYEPNQKPAPAVVLVHMLGRSRDDWNNIADRLEEAGIAAFAFDLRGHGRSSGSNASFPAMVHDVRAAVAWLASRPDIRPDAIAVVGASLGATLALLTAADNPSVRAVALLSPSLDYRGVRTDAATIKKMGDRPMWLAASTQDPYALRTIRELVSGSGAREQRLSGAAAHGTNLLVADIEIARGLVDWLRRTLIF